MNPKIALLLIATLVPAAVLADDQIFKWRDSRGVWHFSSNAPEGVAAERVSIRHSQTVIDPAPVPAPTEGAASGANASTAVADKGKIIGPQSVNCKAAQDAVTVLSNSPKVAMDSDGDGKQEELTAQQQLEELERRRAQAKVYCAEA